MKKDQAQPADIENAHNANQPSGQENQDLPVLEEIAVENGQHLQNKVGELGLKATEESEASSAQNPKEYLSMRPLYYYIVTITCFVVVVLLSIVVGDVSVFFGIIGATLACFMVLVAPGSFYIITVHKKKIGFQDAKSVVLYILAWLLSVIGAI